MGKDRIKAADFLHYDRDCALSRAGTGDRRGAERQSGNQWGKNKMASGNDMKAHESTYTGFLGLVKWGSILTALVTVLVVYLIA